MAAMPFPCNGISLTQGNLPGIFQMSTLKQASYPYPFFKLFSNCIRNGPNLRFNIFGWYLFCVTDSFIIFRNLKVGFLKQGNFFPILCYKTIDQDFYAMAGIACFYFTFGLELFNRFYGAQLFSYLKCDRFATRLLLVIAY